MEAAVLKFIQDRNDLGWVFQVKCKTDERKRAWVYLIDFDSMRQYEVPTCANTREAKDKTVNVAVLTYISNNQWRINYRDGEGVDIYMSAEENDEVNKQYTMYKARKVKL